MMKLPSKHLTSDPIKTGKAQGYSSVASHFPVTLTFTGEKFISPERNGG